MKTILEFEDFVKLLNPVDTYAQSHPELIEKVKNDLPEILLSTWKKYGFQKFCNGFLWTTNPDHYRYLAELFVPKFNAAEVYVLFRTAFGDFIFLYQKNLYSYSVVTSFLLKVSQKLESFIDINLSRKQSLDDGYFFSIYKKALKKMGPITVDEIYAYIPALQLGGEMKTENLQKQNMKAYLLMISNLNGGN